MKIILTSRVSGLGQVGQVVEVKNGYAKNFLIPNKKAICLTKNNEKLFEANRAEFEKENEQNLKLANEVKTSLIAQNIVIIENASDDGRLYGSVNTAKIAEKINEFLKKEAVTKNDIFVEKPIKDIGVHKASIDLHADVIFTVKLVVSRSEAEVEAVLKADEKAKKELQKAIEKEKEEKKVKPKAEGETKAEGEEVKAEVEEKEAVSN